MARTIALVALLLAPSLFAPSPADAELATWNQEKVTAIAGEISEAAQALRTSLRREPPRTLGQPGRRAFWELRDELSSVVTTSRRLSEALSAGEGMEQTYPMYRRLLRTARRADHHTRQIGLGDPVEAKIDVIADAIRRIRPFYEEAPPL